MYRTANNLEDLDILEELNSFDSVGHAVDRLGFWAIEEEYKDVDFFIIMMNDSEEKEIKELLNICFWTAYLSYDDKIVKI